MWGEASTIAVNDSGGARVFGATMKPRTITATPILVVALTASAAAIAAPAREPSKDPKLLALAEELGSTEKDQALARLPYFRPLCDADGYPLVGNLVRKGATYQPSAFCADVRAREKR